ncbi:hypothetical protein [Algoriphagus hitonicola]|uniref:6-bladed beta-propeller protein n=1 Tax=Algoriphagus hitonicola TaxID=435880 RepID=A0A1I2W3M3_9BACT|nr:hypothetical protein [Algoriphagus hitonicola]SFG95902.1 hypothetical protein SAMN04487988_111128 [Algoriphagus hitonicola]
MKIKQLILLSITLISFYCCNSKDKLDLLNGSSITKSISLNIMDSVKIPYLGNPIVHDINPKTNSILFMEFDQFSNDINLVDFDGDKINSFSKFGDIPDGYGKLLASPILLDNNEVLVYGTNGFIRYDYQGNLISKVKISELKFPNFKNRLAMGFGMEKLGDKYLNIEGGSRETVNYDKINLHPEYFLFNLLDPKTGKSKPIIQFPNSSIYRSGKYFFRYAWQPVFSVNKNLIFIVFGGEPAIYIYSSNEPFQLLSKINLDLEDYRYFEGSENENLEHDFLGMFLSSGRIENIKKIEDKFLVAYFEGYKDSDKEIFFAQKKDRNEAIEVRERLKEKYPTRLAVFDSLGNLLTILNPEGLEPNSMLLRDGQLWMMEKPDEEVERDYFRLFRVGLKVENN